MRQLPPRPSETDNVPPAQGRQPRESLRVVITSRTIWLAIWATLASIILLRFLQNIVEILLLLFAAITIAEAMRPAVCWMRRYHIPRWLGVLLIYLLGLGFLTGLTYLMIQPLIEQLTSLITQFPSYMQNLEHLIRSAEGMLSGLPGGATLPSSIGGLLESLLSFLVSIPRVIITILAGIVIVLVMALFWLAYTDGLRDFFLRLFPPRLRGPGVDILDDMGNRLGGYVRGVLIDMFAVGALATLASWLIGLPYPLLLGVFAGLTEFIPLIGPFIGAFPAVLLGFLISPLTGVLAALAYLVIQQLENHTLVPLVMNRVVKLSPLVTLIAVTLGAFLQGLLGALLAVPFAAVAQVFIVRVLAPWIRHTTGAEAEEAAEEQAAPLPPAKEEA
jgi:predicted PurR-regulated permease PerM